MTDDAAPSGIDYRHLLQDALIGVVRRALRQAAEHGLPGEHHFYLSFRTDAEGVDLPPRLARAHPQEMTIVVQHQYWNLDVQDDAFAVTLRFGGAPRRINVPFAALTAFVDPSVPFGLRLQALEGAEEDAVAESALASEAPVQAAAVRDAGATEGTVVDFAAFRKRE